MLMEASGDNCDRGIGSSSSSSSSPFSSVGTGWAQGSSSWSGVLLDLGLDVRLGRTLGMLPLP